MRGLRKRTVNCMALRAISASFGCRSGGDDFPHLVHTLEWLNSCRRDNSVRHLSVRLAHQRRGQTWSIFSEAVSQPLTVLPPYPFRHLSLSYKMSPPMAGKGKESGTARVLGSGTSGTCPTTATSACAVSSYRYACYEWLHRMMFRRRRTARVPSCRHYC